MCVCNREREIIIKQIKSVDNELKQAKIDYLQRDSTIV